MYNYSKPSVYGGGLQEMKNSTTIRVPKKYHHMITEIYKDEDGYWAASSNGYMFSLSECHTAHEETHKDLLRVIRSLTSCDCEECRNGIRTSKTIG